MMKNKQEIKNSIIELMQSNLHENVLDINLLPASGSSRVYYRISTEKDTFIATYNSNIEENKAFLIFSKHFESLNLPVPQILAVNADMDCYIQSDLGDTSLFNYVQDCVKNNLYNDETIELYRDAISNLVDFQIKGNIKLDYSVAYPSSSFDRNSILDDLNYFKYYFLKVNDEIVFNESKLNADFHNIANYIIEAPADYFMYRDFQSRNIMIKDNKTYFIDYQGGRKGPLQYDIVSLLYQVKAQLPDSLRNDLLAHYKTQLSKYLDIKYIEFDKYYHAFVLLRLLQVLGAYGFRGLIQKKQHFIESIPYALNELISLNDKLDFPFETPELNNVLNQLNVLLSKYKHIDNEKLTVTVNSFSYKNGGIPEDRSGNCGGFVFDCRALPNPGRFAEYKKLTGQDAEVQDYLNKYKDVNDFLELTHSLIFQSVENYLERNFKNLFVNFGCTGGQHRSVFFAEKMAHALREKYPQTKVVLNHIAQNKHYVYENE